MNVTLIDHTQNAIDLLLFTKHTRLNMSPGTMDEIRGWPMERKLTELCYMANTIRSSWEFVSYTFLVEGVSRAFTHQLVRTRHGSYAQQSMRVTNMKGWDFVMPSKIATDTQQEAIVETHNAATATAYERLINAGAAEEDARSILPTNIATNIVARFNMRTFVELGEARLGGRTQDEYRRVMEGMVACVRAVHPWIDLFMFGNRGRDYFYELEQFAEREFGHNLRKKGELLKIVDVMRKVRPE